MTAFTEAAGHATAVLSALHALGALVRLWQHRRAGKSGPCGCVVPAIPEESGRDDGGLLPPAPAVLPPAAGVTVTVTGLPVGTVAVVTIAAARPAAAGRGPW
ncbi:hypothetical protein [Streptomyces sp. NPDC001389]|uniref:hypothetical protein n=1 Tax=Streptomyces sp. NPDC001389 TaxID=3364569 RepID=UPI0036A6DC16